MTDDEAREAKEWEENERRKDEESVERDLKETMKSGKEIHLTKMHIWVPKDLEAQATALMKGRGKVSVFEEEE